MKIAVVSDIHVPHWGPIDFHRLVLGPMSESVQFENPDFIVDAGDLEDSTFYSTYFSNVPSLVLAGNHDYYHRTIGYPKCGTETFSTLFSTGNTGHSEGLSATIKGATLWTDMNHRDPTAMFVAERCLNDFRLITHLGRLFSPEDCADLCQEHRRFLITSDRTDVVVTHHLPSFRSVNPKYRSEYYFQDALNFCFASHLDELVESSGAKLWIHGHTHDPCDYRIGKTRVLCNPCGYPHERKVPYVPVYVEV